MIRTIVIAMVVSLGWASMAGAQLTTYFEDGFDGQSLDSAWNVMGAGAYSLVGSDLEFTTAQGELVNPYEQTLGAPRHMFLIDVPDAETYWRAVARVRYNTPDEKYEQVSLLAHEDNDNYQKIAYQEGGAGSRWTFLAEWDGHYSEPTFIAPLHTDYFWLSLERDGNTYSAYWSADSTTDPDLVTWTYIDSQDVDLLNPMVGLAGWNSGGNPSGELAEFDYFRVQVPEPMTITLLACGMGLMGLRRR